MLDIRHTYKLTSPSDPNCFGLQCLGLACLFSICCIHNSPSQKVTRKTSPHEKRCSTNIPFCHLSLCIHVCVFACTHLMTHMCLSCVYSGKTVDCSTTLAALQEAKELVKVFGKRSSCVPGAISIMDNIFNKLQPQVSSDRFEVQVYLICSQNSNSKI